MAAERIRLLARAPEEKGQCQLRIYKVEDYWTWSGRGLT